MRCKLGTKCSYLHELCFQLKKGELLNTVIILESKVMNLVDGALTESCVKTKVMRASCLEMLKSGDWKAS